MYADFRGCQQRDWRNYGEAFRDPSEVLHCSTMEGEQQVWSGSKMLTNLCFF